MELKIMAAVAFGLAGGMAFTTIVDAIENFARFKVATKETTNIVRNNDKESE